MRTSTIFEREAPVGMSPVKVALVMLVGVVMTKSSADSISIFPAEAGREAVAIRPSGSPVLKKNDLAEAAVPERRVTASTTTNGYLITMSCPSARRLFQI